ncbi:conserved protein of unknown function [Nitrospira japonica]|uniref:DUF7948 domain-containing protein n=1 Tax=Nitrospira japonica TaxID=1325564 RepID=A0A1W1I0G8_9BACT|nr:hypothetical protein [Nitrospira japonica]SLM46472.1 conserved protein of unknown function [Nitrospira japonica]
MRNLQGARQLGVVTVLVIGWITPLICEAASHPPSMNPPLNSAQVIAPLMKAPLSFEANQGQTDDSVKFISRGNGYTLFLTPTESVMVLQQREPLTNTDDLGMKTESAPIKQSIVRMALEGVNPNPAIEGLDQLPGIVNYFIGPDPTKWHTKIPTYAQVHYKDVYPGIDVAYYGNQGRLEYDFIVSPGADPTQIRLAFKGNSNVHLAKSGDLLLTTALGEVKLQKPVVYQLGADGHKTLVEANYIISTSSESEVGIQLAAYDTNMTIVIDPVIIYSSFIGGLGIDNAHDVAVDSSGDAWVVGHAFSALTLPVVGIPYDSSYNGSLDVFLLKVSPSGSLLVWTYLGGTFSDNTPAVALDGAGNVWLTGSTSGSTFPITPGALQPVHGGSADAFISKFDSNASTLLYSTFYGSSGQENPRSIAVDASGSIVHLAGNTNSTSLPGVTPSSAQSIYGGGVQDGFLAKLDISSSQIVYATYLGGNDRDELAKVRVDSSGNAHVAGRSFSSDFPGTAGSSISALTSFQPTFGGLVDAIVAKLNPTGTQLIYSTYLGGSSDELAAGLALDSAENAVVSGVTGSSTFPLAGTPFQSTLAAHDYFVTKINSTGTALIFSTLFGGVGDDFGSVVALDPADRIYLTGPTNSCRIPDFSHPLQIDRCSLGAPFNHVIVAKLDANGSNLLSLTVFTGSTGVSGGLGITVDSQENVYVTGVTRASDFTTHTPLQPTYGGGLEDGFVAKIATAVPPEIADYFLHGNGPNANPPTLFVNATAPTATAPKYRDSAGLKFNGGNLWKEIGTWATSLPTPNNGNLTTLSALQVWVGLKNSDDQGTQFDVRAEVYKNATLVVEGLTRCITGVTRNENLATAVGVAFPAFPAVSFNGTTDVLSLKVSARIGTNPDSTKCSGPGGSHNNAVGLRLYFDATDRPAAFVGTFAP